MKVDIRAALANENKELLFEFHEMLQNDLLVNFYKSSFCDGVIVKGTYANKAGDLRFKGVISFDVNGVCDRCGNKAHKAFAIPFEETFFKNPAGPDDEGYKGIEIDLEKAVSDHIVLSLPIGLLCNDACKGLCLKCGTDKNAGGCDCETQN